MICNTNKREKILLVDDDKISLSVIKKNLKKRYKIIPVVSKEKALTYLLRGNIPNLILLDIQRPIADRWETYNRFKALVFLRSVPVVFITSKDESGKVEHMREIGAADYIVKPVESASLMEKIESVLEGRNLKKE
jgi:CheY-like chemotaxis protein